MMEEGSNISEFANCKLTRCPSQEEFDDLGKFIAVAEELSHEPFFSPDNHLRYYPNHYSAPKGYAQFGHPAFLKSAILPFRKLWMGTEPCAFWKIRDFIYELFAENQQLQGLSYWYRRHYKQSLEHQIFEDGKIRTTNQVFDVWINTQAAHTGQRLGKKGSLIGEYTIADFNQAIEQHGRPKFEYQFRVQLQCVGGTYLDFYRQVAIPAFQRLKDEGFEPSFEVGVALSHGFYPNASDEIRITDCFWHLDKETPEETFDRLLQRQDFGNMDNFLCGYFFKRKPALEAVIEFSTLEAFFMGTNGEVIEEALPSDKLMSNFGARGDINYNGGRVHVYEQRRVVFNERSYHFMQQQYEAFRSEYIKHRESIEPRNKKWAGNWHGI